MALKMGAAAGAVMNLISGAAASAHELGARERQNFADLSQANLGLALGNGLRGPLFRSQMAELTREGISNAKPPK